MEATPSLKRPAHKFSFFIAARRLIEVGEFRNINRGTLIDLPFEQYIIHRNCYFLVYDVSTYAGVTQIVLLQLPHGFFNLAQQEGLNLKKIKACAPDYEMLKSYARMDLQEKRAQPVHGYSLSDKMD